MSKMMIHSTKTGKLEVYELPQDRVLRMYVCGVTPYDDAHIGHGRCYVTFDLFYRIFRARGCSVIYCRNVTDIDDKLLRRAASELGDSMLYHEIARRYTQRFQEDVSLLGCHKPTHEPRVTDHISHIVKAVEGLVASGHAYVRNGSVYFRIASYATYGELSGQSIADLQSGARVAVEEDKENPLDFALWKAEPEDTFWQSPWGWGRPGWHIECSALAYTYLGHPIDIHGGGMDLMFPHHENERAQSESLYGCPFVRLWMHNAFVRVKQEKMSKSLNNFVTLRQAFERVHPMVLRYYYLTNHYRNPLDFAWDDIAVAQKSYQKLVVWYGATLLYSEDELPRLFSEALEGAHGDAVKRMVTYLCHDGNVQGMIGVIFEQRADRSAVTDRIVATLLRTVCGLSLQELPVQEREISSEAQALIEARRAARAARDWQRADEIRDQLRLLGVDVRDDKL